MDERYDLEETLRRLEHEPEPRVRRALLKSFEETQGPRRRRRLGVRLYAVAALLALAFLAGRWSAPAPPSTDSEEGVVPAAESMADMEWTGAEGDLL